MSQSPARKDALPAIAQLLKEGQYRQAQNACVALLEKAGLTAQLWVYLGEALLRLGYGRAAGKAFERASLLDPQAAWVEAVDAALRNVADGPEVPEVDRLLTVKRVTVTAAIIARNEARCIARCLSSLAGAVDDLLVIDSGSTDGTLDIVAEYPRVRVIPNTDITDDFAGLRNLGLAHIETDWVLWVDADEWLEPEDRRAVREIAGLFDEVPQPPVLNVCQVNRVGDTVTREYSLPRLFPLGRGLRYYGKVHEQVVLEGQDMFAGHTIRQAVRIRLHHDGYEPDIMRDKRKLERNLKLLKRMVEEEPDNPGWLLYYGRETLGTGDTEAAERIFLEAERKASGRPRFGRMLDLYGYLVKIYFSRSDYDRAADMCEKALRLHPDYPDMLYWSAQIRMRQAVALLQQSEKELKAAKKGFSTYRGGVTADRTILDWKADAALGDLARLTGKKEEARSVYRGLLKRHPGLTAVRKKLDKLDAADRPSESSN